jgi:peptidoglycan/xylan/chitin deacetylase (PgdA/CDA1 family)
MDKLNILIVIDNEDASILGDRPLSKHWNVFWYSVDYNNLYEKISLIKELIYKNNINLILYSRNDQVGNRIKIGPITRYLKVGYSSFSGIDERYRVAEMKQCFEDFINPCRRLNFEIYDRKYSKSFTKIFGNVNYSSVKNSEKGTFTLVFDVEQLGGVRYGLPRILYVLDIFDIKATFFVTNFMKKIYCNILEEIRSHGHEVGIHGLYHEYLSNYNQKVQEMLIRKMISDFGDGITGANFIGRMNKDTLHALVNNEIKYFVHPLINRYHLFSYRKIPAIPQVFQISGKEIWMLPIAVETYGLPFLSIKNMVDSALKIGQRYGVNHLTLLLHDFRDGNVRHIQTTVRLIYYLIQKGLRPIMLKDVINEFSERKKFYVSLDDEIFFQGSEKISPPMSKEDFIGFIPENLINFYKFFKWKYEIF